MQTFKNTRGFTLVELLAVVAIISIMAVLIGLGLRGGNESISVANGQRVASSIFQSARSVAVLRQTHTRVIIYGQQASDIDPRKFLRYMGVVALKDGVTYDPNTNTSADWEPVNNGTYLPEGVFFIPNPVPSKLIISSANDTVETVKDTSQSGDFKFPVNASGYSDESFYYYTFDSNGMSQDPGDTFVICAGRVSSEGDGDVEITIENAYATAGFALRRIGGVTLFSEYDELAAINGN